MSKSITPVPSNVIFNLAFASISAAVIGAVYSAQPDPLGMMFVDPTTFPHCSRMKNLFFVYLPIVSLHTGINGKEYSF